MARLLPQQRLSRVVRVVAASAAVVVASACAAPTVERATPGVTAARPALFAGSARAVPVGSVSAADVGAAQRAFGLDILHALCATSKNANVTLSATSAAEALGLLYAAAGGTTATDLRRLLHLPAWGPDLIAGLAAHSKDLAIRGPKKGEGLFLSNRVWTSLAAHPDAAYLDDVATAYGAGLRTLDFARDPGGATKAINDAVSADTQGLIKRLFEQTLDPSTTSVLTNALYLKARWQRPFLPDVTRPAAFHAPGGDVTVPTMGKAWGTERAAAGWTAVEMPYVGDALTAVAVLPPAGVAPCAVSSDVLDRLAIGPAPTSPASSDGGAPDTPGATEVTMPKFHLEQSLDLLPVLRTLGFPASGDFGRLGGGTDVSQVVQKTFLDVDEAGTTAAAATGVMIPASLPPTVVFDRPFVFLLMDTATHSPLFTAVVNDPSARS